MADGHNLRGHNSRWKSGYNNYHFHERLEYEIVEKGNDGLFRAKNNQIIKADVNVQVLGGTLESSNVNPVNEMTEMIALQRQFEMQLKMILQDPF